MERMEVRMMGGKRTSREMETAETISQCPEVEAILAEMKAGNFGFNARYELWNKKTWNIIKMRLQFPASTNTELAKRLNVSREWVRCVLNRANLPTRAQGEYNDLVCTSCGIIFRKKKANIELLRAKGQTRFYHDKKCFYKDLRRYLLKRKWDHEVVFKLKKERKWGAVRIGMELGIPPRTVLEILRNKRGKSIGNRIWEHTCCLIGKIGHFLH